MFKPRAFHHIIIAILTVLVVTISIITTRQGNRFPAGASAADPTPEERGLHNLRHNSYGAPAMNKKLLLEILP
ncbi:MAG: hypothetical protein ACREEM_44550, partial [Blastocatellia bacterium]